MDPSENYIWACCDGDVETVRDYLGDPSARSNEAIACAAEAGHVEVVQLLLGDARVDPRYALCLAARFGNGDVVAIMLADSRVDAFSASTALLCACEQGHDAVVDVFLANRKSFPFSLETAARRGFVHAARHMLRTRPSQDTLDTAIVCATVACARLLLSAGAKCLRPDAIHYSAVSHRFRYKRSSAWHCGARVPRDGPAKDGDVLAGYT